MLKGCPLLSLLLVVLGCVAGPPVPPATPEQQAWYARRDATPTTFSVSADQGEVAWSRAKSWLAQCSDFKLQTVDAEILETFNPPSEVAVRMGYSVSRERLEDGSWRFRVRSMTGNSTAGQVAGRYAQALALYIVTAEDCPGCPCGTRR
jgi:hypothetical protein